MILDSFSFSMILRIYHQILVSAPVPLELILTGFDWVGALGVWIRGPGLTIGCFFVWFGMTIHKFLINLSLITPSLAVKDAILDIFRYLR